MLDKIISLSEKKKNKLRKKLLKLTDSIKDKLMYLYCSDEYSSSILDYTEDGLIDEWLDNKHRHSTIIVLDMVESIFESYTVDNYKDYVEICDMFSHYNVYDSEEKFIEDTQSDDYYSVVDKQDFVDLANDIINNNVSSFKLDW